MVCPTFPGTGDFAFPWYSHTAHLSTNRDHSENEVPGLLSTAQGYKPREHAGAANDLPQEGCWRNVGECLGLNQQRGHTMPYTRRTTQEPYPYHQNDEGFLAFLGRGLQKCEVPEGQQPLFGMPGAYVRFPYLPTPEALGKYLRGKASG